MYQPPTIILEHDVGLETGVWDWGKLDTWRKGALLDMT